MSRTILSMIVVYVQMIHSLSFRSAACCIDEKKLPHQTEFVRCEKTNAAEREHYPRAQQVGAQS